MENFQVPVDGQFREVVPSTSALPEAGNIVTEAPVIPQLDVIEIDGVTYSKKIGDDGKLYLTRIVFS